MNPQFTDNEIKNFRRLGTRLNSGVIDVDQLRTAVNGLLQKVNTPAATLTVRLSKREERKEIYRNKLGVR